MLVADINQIKGLEFFNVLVWDSAEKFYPDNQLSRRQLYVAATRAEENLCFVHWGKGSGLLTGIAKKEIRRYSY